MRDGRSSILAEKVGTFYLPAINVMNLRAQKEFVVKDTQRVHLMLNIFNLAGAESVTDVVEVRFGLRYTF